MSDCATDVRLSSDNPQQFYTGAFCECYTPKRARMGPKNLVGDHAENIEIKIQQDVWPQCESQALAKFTEMSSLAANFRHQFSPACIEKPFMFYGENESKGKTKELCDCMGKGLLSDDLSMASFVAGAGRFATRPKVVEQRNLCIRQVFPPSAATGWQVSKRPDGTDYAVVESRDHDLISKIEFRCTTAGQPRFNISWKKSPPKDQIVFLGGDFREDVIIPLKKGVAEGNYAKKLYDEILFWQKVDVKDGHDLDYKHVSISPYEDIEIGNYGIVLGNTKMRIENLFMNCRPKPQDQAVGARSNKPEQCGKVLDDASRAFGKENSIEVTDDMLRDNNKFCQLAARRVAVSNRYLSAAKGCPDHDKSGVYKRNVTKYRDIWAGQLKQCKI